MLTAASGQENIAPTTAHVWLDTFGGSQGAVVYPQYGWSVATAAGNFSGFGFVEVAPREQLFTNHLVIYTPSSLKWLSVHTETRGVPRAGLSFFQVGPRVNFTEAIPKLNKPLNRLFFVALPSLAGIRTNNLLLAGATNRYAITESVQVSVEGYRRFFGSPQEFVKTVKCLGF